MISWDLYVAWMLIYVCVCVCPCSYTGVVTSVHYDALLGVSHNKRRY